MRFLFIISLRILFCSGGLGSFLRLTFQCLQCTGRDFDNLRLAVDDHMYLLQIRIPLAACSAQGMRTIVS